MIKKYILYFFTLLIFYGQVEATDTTTVVNIKILPFVTKLQIVGDHPYDWNDGAMIPAKGWQQYTNWGFQLQWKKFEVQIAPEFVSAQNLPFEGFSADMDPVQWRDYYRFYNHIELPEQFGILPYRQFFTGQSYLQYQTKNTRIQLSSANKWWGPGFRNSLILSNNANGFPHVSISNKFPIKTRLGQINYELMWGQLINNGFPPPMSYLTFRGNALFAPKEDRQRMFQGMHVQFQPKWFTNLSVGIEQSFIQYNDQLTGVFDYLPLKNIMHRLPNDVSNQPIVLTAVYFKYHLPVVQANLYGEFGWNLNRTSFRNWLLQPDKGLGSVLGLSKIFNSVHNHYWEFLAEMTNLQLQTRAEQFSTGVPPSWYLSPTIRQGYTNNGQIIGAGIGPGATSQTIELNWRKSNNRIGISAERRLHNNDFYVYSFTNSGDFRRWYVDFATTLKIDWSFGRWMIGPRLTYLQTNNYNWWLFQPANSLYFIPGKDKQQILAQLNLIYRL